MRHFWNRNKWRRSFGRRFSVSKKGVISLSRFHIKRKTHGVDYAWRGKSVNPFARDTTNWAWRLKLLLAVILFLVALALLFFHKFFQITKIEISGRERLNQQSVTDTVIGALHRPVFWFLPGQNYFLVDTEYTVAVLNKKYPLEFAVVKKRFPNTLLIEIKEKPAAIIYDNGREYSYLDLGGVLIERLRQVADYEWLAIAKQTTTTVATTTNENKMPVAETVSRVHMPDITIVRKEMGQYPLVFDSRSLEVGLNEAVLPQNYVSDIIAWNKFLDEVLSLPVKYILIEDGLGDALIKTYLGVDIKVRFGEGSSEQLSGLAVAIKEKINLKKVKYIDARYPGKFFWE